MFNANLFLSENEKKIVITNVKSTQRGERKGEMREEIGWEDGGGV